MAVIALVSAKSCGVTTSALALALASPRPTLLAECDPAGGSIRAGYLQSQLDASIGLHRLASAGRQSPAALAEAFERQLRALDAAGDRQLLAGLTDPRQAAALAGTWPQLAQLLELMDTRVGYEVVVDAGRLVIEAGGLHAQLSPAALLHRADAVLLVLHAHASSLALASAALEVLRADLAAHGSDPDALGLLLIERGPYQGHDIARHLQTPVLGLLPWDRAAGDYLAMGGSPPRGLGRSMLLRAARSASGTIAARAQQRQLHRAYPAQPANAHVAGIIERLARRGQVNA